jgi:hypothetical protein
MKILNIITPCSRPENLKSLFKSIQKPDDTEVYWYIVYDLGIKPELGLPKQYNGINIIEHLADKKSVSGNNLRNWALDQITEGFVYLLDDDNIFNPNFWLFFNSFKKNYFHSFLTEFIAPDNIVIRKFRNEWHVFTSGRIRGARNVKITRGAGMPTFELAMERYPELLKKVPNYRVYLYPCMPKVDHIDSSMCCVDRSLIGDSRFQENAYNADSIFLEEVFLKSRQNFSYIDEYLGYYNYLERSKT